jgi:hypothetical protein
MRESEDLAGTTFAAVSNHWLTKRQQFRVLTGG